MKCTTASARPGGAGNRMEMLSQYVKAIDETILSFQQACRQHPQDEQLANAFAQFRRELKSQMVRLEAMRRHLTDEEEIRALERAIRSVKQVT